MFAWIIAVVVSLALSVLAYFLAPKPKQQTPDNAKEMDNPTADAGRPIPVVFGEMIVKSPNCLWYGDKQMVEYEVRA